MCHNTLCQSWNNDKASTKINPSQWQSHHRDQRHNKDSQYCWVVYIVLYCSPSASNKPHKIVNHTLSYLCIHLRKYARNVCECRVKSIFKTSHRKFTSRWQWCVYLSFRNSLCCWWIDEKLESITLDRTLISVVEVLVQWSLRTYQKQEPQLCPYQGNYSRRHG